MNGFFNACYALIFPSIFDKQELVKIPKAPEIKGTENFAIFDYRSRPGRKLIHTIKKHSCPTLNKELATLLYQELLEYLSEQQSFEFFKNPIVVTIPMTQKQLNKRGFHQCKGIAREFAQLCNGVYLHTILVKNRETEKQALLHSRSARFKNIKGCFSVNKKSPEGILHRDCIIIDDLTTTGATLDEAKKVLRKNGARNIIAIAIAH